MSVNRAKTGTPNRYAPESSKRQPCAALGPKSAEKFDGGGAAVVNSRERIEISGFPNIEIPVIEEGDRFVEFEVVRGTSALKADAERAVKIGTPKWDFDVDAKKTSGGFHLRLYPEQYRYVDFKSAAPETVEVFIHNVVGKWFVYKTFQRVAHQHHVDRFLRKARYLGTIPGAVVTRRSFTEICNHLAVLEILAAEEQRKIERRFGASNGARLTMRSARGHPLANESQASGARDRIRAPNCVKIHVSKQLTEIVRFARDGIARLEEEAKRNSVELVRTLQAYVGRSTKRLALCDSRPDFLKIQAEMNRLLPRERLDADEFLYLKNVTVSELTSGLIDFPYWVDHHFLFVRSRKRLQIAWKFGELAVIEEGKRRMMKVRNSRYRQRVQPVKALKSSTVVDGPELSIACFAPPPRPPSVDSESGMSTVISMSTATTSPNSWEYHPWEMQPDRDEMLYRLDDESLHNPKDFRAKGAKSMAERRNAEINHRLELLTRDFEDLQRIMPYTSLVEDALMDQSDRRGDSIPLGPLGNLEWLQKSEDEIRRILKVQMPSVEQKKRLQVLLYAKERYEATLVSHDKRLRGNPEASGLAEDSRIAFNETWRRMVNAKLVPNDAAVALRYLVGGEKSWILDSPFSNLALAKRCDRQVDVRKAKIFNHLATKVNRRIVIVVLVFSLLAAIGLLVIIGIHSDWHAVTEKMCVKHSKMIQDRYAPPEQLRSFAFVSTR